MTSEITIPTQLHSLIGKVRAVETKRHDEILKIETKTLDSAIPLAVPFAAAFDKFGTDHGLVSRTGNVVASRVIETLTAAGESLPSQPMISRMLGIGRFLVAGEELSTLQQYRDAAWSQPADVVADGTEPVTVTNNGKLETFATWCNVKASPGQQTKSHRVVDDVLFTHDRWEELNTKPEPKPEPVEAEAEAEAEAAPVVSVEPEPAKVTNVVNTGALAAVFASCDSDTVAAISAEYDWTEYSAEELRSYALSALATLTLIEREAEIADLLVAS